MPSKEHTDKKNLISRRTAAAKVLVAQISWLDGAITAASGSLEWIDRSGQKVRANAELLATTQRHLYKLRQDYAAAEKLIPDFDRWFDSHQRLLDEAKVLQCLRLVPRDKPNITLSELLNWLVAEAVAVDIGESVAPRIVKLGQSATPSLISLVTDAALPMQSRTFTAMVLGAITRAQAEKLPRESREQRILTAYKFGVAHGVDASAAVMNRFLLTGKDGSNLARQAKSALNAHRHIKLAPNVIPDLIRSGTCAKRIIALLENVAKIQTLSSEINCLKIAEPPQCSIFEEERAWLRASAERLISEVSVCSADPETPLLVARLIGRCIEVLDVLRMKRSRRCEFVELLQQVIDLPSQCLPQLQADCLRLVVGAIEDGRVLELPSKRIQPPDVIKETLNTQFSHEIEHVPALLNSVGDFAVLKKLQKSSNLAALSHVPDVDPETVRLFAALITNRNITCGIVSETLEMLATIKNNQKAKQDLFDIVLLTLRPGELAPFWFVYDVVRRLRDWTGVNFREALPIASLVLHSLNAAGEYELDKHYWDVLSGALAVRHWKTHSLKTYIDTMVAQCLATKRAPDGTRQAYLEYPAILFAAYLGGGRPEMMERIFQTSLAHRMTINTEKNFEALTVLERTPVFLKQLQKCFLLHAGSTRAFFDQVGIARQMSLPLMQLLEPFETELEFVCECSICMQLNTYGDEVKMHWKRYAFAQTLAQLPHDAPSAVRKLLDMQHNIEIELHYLEKMQTPSSSARITQRIQKLRHYRDNPELLRADAESILRKELEKSAAQSYVNAAVALIRRAIDIRCNVEQFAALGLSQEELFDLMVLKHSVGANRSTLSRLLRACLRGDMRWPHKQLANQRYLAQMREKGLNVDVWLSEFPAHFSVPNVSGPLRISIEQNPIEILKMGVYFSTCLSFDGINAFSSIANATDLNKRVIYVRNTAGKVLARKLIAISDRWKLMGYNNYCIYESDTMSTPIKQALHKYAKVFAEECGIPLGDGEQVPRIVSDCWYDDGTVSWDDSTSEADSNPKGQPVICYRCRHK